MMIMMVMGIMICVTLINDSFVIRDVIKGDGGGKVFLIIFNLLFEMELLYYLRNEQMKQMF